MAQFHCEICGQGFEQKSAYERHRITSHPLPEPSVADLESLLKGLSMPCGKDAIYIHARRAGGNDKQLDLIQQLPEREYRDSAEVAKAVGEVKSHVSAGSQQPSKLGGEQALQSLSAAKLAHSLKGIDFPATTGEVYRFARDHSEEEIRLLVSRFANRTFRDMADVEKEAGRLLR